VPRLFSLRGSVSVLALYFLLAAGVACAADAPSQYRQKTNINAFWKYQQGDVTGAQTPAFDDAAWQSVGLPHSFSMPYFMSQDFYMGYGWYRKHQQLPDSLAGKCVFLEFEGVFQEAEVFVNGKPVGSHKGGYTGFSLNITSAVHPGDNVIAVRVNNNWNARLAPRSGEHVFSGGIYRNVFLTITDALHVDWYGTFVTTPDATATSAVVKVSTDFVNDSTAPKNATIRQQVLDPDGKAIAEFSASRPIAGLTTLTVDMASPELKNPKLWHPDHPSLYSLKTTVLDGDRIADEYTTPFGIRTIKWTADQGFFLNGEHFYILGANVHQDEAGWGDARTDADSERDVRLMKQAGFNFIRGSHYPHSPAFAAACDRLGILYWSENDFWSTAQGRQPEGYFNGSGYPTRAQDQPDFDANAKEQLTEMIRINRNHPSIVAWSMCNEPFFSSNSVMPKVRTFLKDLVDLTHKLDSSRPAALGGVQRPTDQNRLDKIGDIAGYNGDGASIQQFQNPGFPNIVSEYSSTSSDRPGRFDPGWGDLARTPGANRTQPASWRFPWRSGEVLWCGFDHGTLASASFGKMGIVDYFRIPKRSWYWYRNEYAKVPPPEWPQAGTPARLKLEADKTNAIRTDGTDSSWLLVTVLNAEGKPISNSPTVELVIVKGPGEFPTGPSITFESGKDIRIQDGQAAITFRSYYAGDTVIRATSPGLPPAEITLHFTGPVPFVEGKTPPVQPRPYVKYVRTTQPAPSQTFGRNNPTFPSSAADGHAGASANDGDAKTWWQPADNDPNPSWTLDAERFVNMSRLSITFTKADIYRLKIDVSDDQQAWRPLADLSNNDRSSATLELAAPANTSGRFVRLQFQPLASKAPLQLAEFEMTGTLRNR
jgi:beta-galactosidase